MADFLGPFESTLQIVTFYFHSKFDGSISIRNFEDIPETRRNTGVQGLFPGARLWYSVLKLKHICWCHIVSWLWRHEIEIGRVSVFDWKILGKQKDEIVSHIIATGIHFCMLCMWLVVCESCIFHSVNVWPFLLLPFAQPLAWQAVRSFIEAWDLWVEDFYWQAMGKLWNG